MVGYIKNLKSGQNIISRIDDVSSNMLMDIDVYNLTNGDEISISEENKEVAVLILTGEVLLKWDDCEKMIKRNSIFDESPSVLHVCSGSSIKVKALKDSEVLVQCTVNERSFEAKLYTPEDCISDIFGDGVWDGTARRVVRTVFDYNNAPYSNMVMGEVITYPGKWSSYPPHHHPQPEVYFYKFDKPQGFGFSLIGENAYKIENNSFSHIEGGLVHPQTSAPGYAMYYCWMIRHFHGNPWTTRVNDEKHTWLLEDNVKIWPEK
jgi:5-deoxy-glucuronate isomerase